MSLSILTSSPFSFSQLSVTGNRTDQSLLSRGSSPAMPLSSYPPSQRYPDRLKLQSAFLESQCHSLAIQSKLVTSSRQSPPQASKLYSESVYTTGSDTRDQLNPRHISDTKMSSSAALDCGPCGFLVDIEGISPPADPLRELY
eukprot:IDg18064t1